MNRRSFFGAFARLAAAPAAIRQSEAQPAAALVGKNGPELLRLRVINVFDPSIAGDYLRAEEAERMIAKVIRRNRTV